MAWTIGELVKRELDSLAGGEVSGPPGTRRRRSPGSGAPTPRRRFTRIHVTDEEWVAVRSQASATSRTAARYVGELVEAEAFRLGWRQAKLDVLSESGDGPPGERNVEP